MDSVRQKHLVIIGGGTAGTMIANRMAKRLSSRDWKVVLVDPSETHLYQPGLLFLPFGALDEEEDLRPRAWTLHKKVEWMRTHVLRVDTAKKRVEMQEGEPVPYDLLVIASGSRIRPDLTEGMQGPAYGKSVHDFYTLPGALALRDALDKFSSGRIVVNIVEMPIKCPVAPLEFTFLADDFFRKKGLRDKVELVYVTPLDGAFTKPIASKLLGGLLDRKGIRVETEFSCARVDAERGVIVSWDEREIPYDLLVTIPTHSGAEFVEKSGLGNELGFIPTDPHTLKARGHDDIFVIGDATDVPASKAGSVAHFEAEVLTENLTAIVHGDAPEMTFDGHANCFVETGDGKALLIDFNYDVEPLPGSYPLPIVGPFSLLEESTANHLGKLAFRWMYWNGLLPGKPIPLPAQMSMVGKQTKELSKEQTQ
ncbi:MAG: FAD/NAD(P)-binding oxidoreductase [Polyangiaceae bacterium]